MEVLCVRGSKFLIKGEWYKVIPWGTGVIYTQGVSQSFQLENHTDIPWSTSWYHKTNFATVQELREYKLNQILLLNND